MPTKRSKTNTVKKISKPSKSTKVSEVRVHPMKCDVKCPLLFLTLLTLIAVLITLGYFYRQQYKYMIDRETGAGERMFESREQLNRNK